MTRISHQSDRGARVRRAFTDQAGFCDRLDSPFTGLLCRALADGLDGSSAGLNLIADRYAYRFGALHWAPDSISDGSPTKDLHGLTITCEWQGRPPAVDAPLRVRSRRGCDRQPLNVTEPAQRERLLAYVWPDQRERLDRVDAAITTNLAQPVVVETSDAAQWLDAVLAPNAEPNVTRVVFHSIVWSYLDRSSQARIADRMAKTGAAASADSPLAWLRLELVAKDQPAELRLTMWPDGSDELLARAHPHGAWVRWCD